MSVWQSDSEHWDKILDVNVKAAFLLAKEAYPHLKQSGNASITFVTSIAAYQPLHKLGPYSVAKTALLGLTKVRRWWDIDATLSRHVPAWYCSHPRPWMYQVLSEECAPDGIRVNGLAPGIIKTKFSSALTDDGTVAKKNPSSRPPGASPVWSLATNVVPCHRCVVPIAAVRASRPDCAAKPLAGRPQRRFGLPEEMGSVVAFLASDDASYISGETLIASGGMTGHL